MAETPIFPLKPAKKKAKPKLKPAKGPTLDEERQDLILPEALRNMPVTARKLANGKFQKAVLAYFANPASAAIFKGMIVEAEGGNVAAARLLADMYQYVAQKNGGINIMMSQNNANVSERRGRDSDGPISFEQIARILEEEDQQRKSLPPALDVQFEATPDSIIEG
jgi:hypothetical protein